MMLFKQFYGSTGVYESKGDAAVKSAIQELAYQSNAGNSQAGTVKPPRVFLNISADKVTIRESKIRVSSITLNTCTCQQMTEL